MCAAGVLIPDDEYDSEMEGSSVNGIDGNVKLRSVFKSRGIDILFVAAMQTIHDKYEPYEWEAQFERTARKWKLVVPPLD